MNVEPPPPPIKYRNRGYERFCFTLAAFHLSFFFIAAYYTPDRMFPLIYNAVTAVIWTFVASLQQSRPDKEEVS